tara:strand:+ start:79 stop:963 length:885 start_codon:yes stop_codon:yes gene_type:complete
MQGHQQTVEAAAGETPAQERPESQRVQMSRAELELYLRDGRPTGLLLRSVALLKGMTVASVAQASGIPANLVESIFNDRGIGSIKKGAIKRVATVLGIDLSVMKFASGQVHVFNLAQLPGRIGSKGAYQAVRAVGLLARAAYVGELKVGAGLQSLMWRGRMHVVQSETFRALFIGSATKKFDISFLPSADWVCGNRADSVVAIENAELSKLLMARDLTEGEFDELFQGARALTWDDVRVASRVNGVSKTDLLKFIESRAKELDETEDDQARLAAMEGRPFLSLVHDGQRQAVNA